MSLPVLVIVMLLLLPYGGAHAQGNVADLRREIEIERQKLSEQMQQLEEQLVESRRRAKRLDELEAQLAGMQSAERSSEIKPQKDLAGIAPALGSEPADQEEPERIVTGNNETRDAHQVLTADDLIADDFIGSWPLFGTDYRMKFGGYVKLDALYDFDGSGDKNQFLIAQIPVEGTPEAERDGYFNMSVRETRFNFDVRGTDPDGPATQAFVEMDFFDENSVSPRLRHAYVVYGNLLFGQTWTTVTEMASIPFVIDFGGGDALFGTRTPQVRWTQQINPSWSWAVALEQLQSPGIYNPLDQPGSANTKLPVFAGRLTRQTSRGIATLAALVQELRWDGQGDGPDPSATGWALIFGGRRNIAGGDYFTLNLAYGDGTPETIMALTGSQANAVLEEDGRLTTRKGYSVALGYGHKWSPSWTTNIAYAFTDLEDLGLNQRAPDAIQSGGVGHVNLIWSGVDELSAGVELIWGDRENVDGADGHATRVQAMLKYGF